MALQEVTARTLPLWREALAAAGLAVVETSLDGLPAVSGRRALGVLMAAREPLERLPPPVVPWPERVLCCRLVGIELINLHSPIAPAPELAKVRTHEAVAAYLADAEPGPWILCGDLNTPRRELPDGDVLTFAYTSAGRLRPERGERWDRAERALVHWLRQRGWVDAFRALYGYSHREASWTFAGDRGDWLGGTPAERRRSGRRAFHVATLDDWETVIGYFALAAAQVAPDEATERALRGQPRARPVPAILLARLAVDRAHQRVGLGRSLLQEVLLRCVEAAEAIGARVLLVHAKRQPAKTGTCGTDSKSRRRTRSICWCSSRTVART